MINNQNNKKGYRDVSVVIMMNYNGDKVVMAFNVLNVPEGKNISVAEAIANLDSMLESVEELPVQASDGTSLTLKVKQGDRKSSDYLMSMCYNIYIGDTKEVEAVASRKAGAIALH